MARLNLKKFIEPKEERSPFQTRVLTVLLSEVNELRKNEGLSWQDLIEALFKYYVSESKKEKSHA